MLVYLNDFWVVFIIQITMRGAGDDPGGTSCDLTGCQLLQIRINEVHGLDDCDGIEEITHPAENVEIGGFDKRRNIATLKHPARRTGPMQYVRAVTQGMYVVCGAMNGESGGIDIEQHGGMDNPAGEIPGFACVVDSEADG